MKAKQSKNGYATAKARVAASRFKNAGNPLTFVAETIKQVEGQYSSLKGRNEQEAFWDEFTAALDQRTPQGWAAVYHGLALLRKADWYWKAKGYKTFADYLRSDTAFTFRQLEQLEARYRFAATACPQLFNMTPKAADAYMAAHGISAGLPAVGDEKGGAPKGNSNASKNNAKRKKSVSGCFSPASEVDVESQPEEFQRGFKARGGGTHYCRFRRLKRDAPKVAQMILDGDFTRERKNGSMYVDMMAAEKLAEKEYGAKPPKVRPSTKKTPVEKAQVALSRLSPDEWNAVVAWMNAQN